MRSEHPEIWGGVECTINRVRDNYFDQLEYSGHYNREDDLEKIASVGIKRLRYPVLWEKHCALNDQDIDWSFAEKSLTQLRNLGVTPIAGLVHHGSGPSYVNFFDGSFEEGLAQYAGKVARRFPWLQYFTPVNEPLTTARFCGLYGHWYPHGADDYSFYKVLLSECKATVMAMMAIREAIPDARLVQTEDLGKCYSTPLLAYQAELENHRRWLSYDLLCGKVDSSHYMWGWMLKAGIKQDELLYFLKNNCVPHVAGFNYYITSERYLDEDLSRYPQQYHGGNWKHTYADIETVKIELKEPSGPAVLLREAYEHLQIPLAITECHLHAGRGEQLQWFHEMWQTAIRLRREGVDIVAVTAWAVLGLYGWNCLVTKPWGDYEPGVFDVRCGQLRATALAGLLRALSNGEDFYHPLLEAAGWWKRDTRLLHYDKKIVNISTAAKKTDCRPLMIIGNSNALGTNLSRICKEREIAQTVISPLNKNHNDIRAFNRMLEQLSPWAIINTSGYHNVDRSEEEKELCFEANCEIPSMIASMCSDRGIKFLSYSTDQVFNGKKQSAYLESDETAPLNVFGWAKLEGERAILSANTNALLLRIGGLFSPVEECTLFAEPLIRMRQGQRVSVARDAVISLSYVPDLADATIDLLLDDEKGIFHVVNDGKIREAELLWTLASASGLDLKLVDSVESDTLQAVVPRPAFRAMASERGILLPKLERALEDYLRRMDHSILESRIAI